MRELASSSGNSAPPERGDTTSDRRALSIQTLERLIERDLMGGRVDMAASVLSPREREVLILIAEGKSTKEIAFTLNISVKTAETHRKSVMEKLSLQSVAELTRYAVREGLVAL
jgi:DNA-binding CsgD family transcriptional regulator